MIVFRKKLFKVAIPMHPSWNSSFLGSVCRKLIELGGAITLLPLALAEAGVSTIRLAAVLECVGVFDTWDLFIKGKHREGMRDLVTNKELLEAIISSVR